MHEQCSSALDMWPGYRAVEAEQLATRAGRWPVLLNLVNGLLRRRTDRRQPRGEAASEILRRLTVEGPTGVGSLP